tara:strand:+ start:47 stop:502 length:456 start_codon:yes stop_codon:yes gene_type:complete
MNNIKDHQIEAISTERPLKYWEGRGEHQEAYDQAYTDLVPPSGEADTYFGEAVRSISRLYYEFCNNGNCNALNADWDDYEEEYTTYEVADFYQKRIDFLDDYGVPFNYLRAIEECITGKYGYNNPKVGCYDDVVDWLMTKEPKMTKRMPIK